MIASGRASVSRLFAWVLLVVIFDCVPVWSTGATDDSRRASPSSSPPAGRPAQPSRRQGSTVQQQRSQLGKVPKQQQQPWLYPHWSHPSSFLSTRLSGPPPPPPAEHKQDRPRIDREQQQVGLLAYGLLHAEQLQQHIRQADKRRRRGSACCCSSAGLRSRLV